MTPASMPLRLCLVDMNNGVANEATRCFRRLFDAFTAQVRAANPGLEITLQHVQPRNLGELPDHRSDLVLSSGGPGAPTDGYEDAWALGYRKFVDHVVDSTLRDPSTSPALFAVCHSFQVCVQHFGVATMARRERLRFGVFPAYVTEQGRSSIVFKPFEDGRLFTWEHRNFEATIWTSSSFIAGWPPARPGESRRARRQGSGNPRTRFRAGCGGHAVPSGGRSAGRDGLGQA